MLEEIVGGEQQNALMDLLENTRIDAFDAAGCPRLNSITMSNFEQNFLAEMNEAANQTELLTVRDLQKIRSMLKYIYRHVMRLKSPAEKRNE